MERVRVALRVRPDYANEAGHSSVEVVDEKSVQITHLDRTARLDASGWHHRADGGDSENDSRPSVYGKDLYGNDIGGNNRSAQVRQFKFDRVFGENCSQDEVFDDVRPLVDSVVNGYNATVFAYGCTGSGKTHTMFGHKNGRIDERGIVPRTIDYLFDQLTEFARSDPEAICAVYLSFVELYNNQFIDLLDTSTQRDHSPFQHHNHSTSSTASHQRGRHKIELHEKPGHGVVLTGSPWLRTLVTSARHTHALVERGHARRAVSRTNLNERSSRSHTIITINVELRSGGDSSLALIGKLNLVDLAGSERASLSGVQDEALRETRSINLSLSTLGDVLSAVSQQSRRATQSSNSNNNNNNNNNDNNPLGFNQNINNVSNNNNTTQSSSNSSNPLVPYRNSKLTFFLKDSLGGSAKTLMIATLRRPRLFHQQTLMTLLYASRARRIRNATVVNVDCARDSAVQQLYINIQALKSALSAKEEEIKRFKVREARAIQREKNAGNETHTGGGGGVSDREGDGGPPSRDLHEELERLKAAYEDQRICLEQQLNKVVYNHEHEMKENLLRSQMQKKEILSYQARVQNQQQQIVELEQSMRKGATNTNRQMFADPDRYVRDTRQTSSDLDDNNNSNSRNQNSNDSNRSDRIAQGSRSSAGSSSMRLSHMRGGDEASRMGVTTRTRLVDDENGASALLMRALRKDLVQRNAHCTKLQGIVDAQAQQIYKLKRGNSRGGGAVPGDVNEYHHGETNFEGSHKSRNNSNSVSNSDSDSNRNSGSNACETCESSRELVRSLRNEIANLKTRLAMAEYGLRASGRSVSTDVQPA